MIRTFVLPSAARRAVLLAGAVVLLSACGGHESSSGTAMNHGGALPSVSGTPAGTLNDADVAFAQHMIPHHQQALKMATLADGRASAAEVKELAAEIKRAQQPEIDTMNGWLTAWGQPMPMEGEDHSSMPGMMSEEDMAELGQASGTAFDKRFLTMMISHHEGAITMARGQIAEGANPDAKALAQTIATDQQAEITTMKAIQARL